MAAVELFASTSPAGAFVSALVVEARRECRCVGICATVRVTVSCPPLSPMLRLVNPDPVPVPTGTRPCISGSPKVVMPSPPKLVPSRLKSAVFWEMERSCPLHCAHPTGAKLKATNRISPRNGSTCACAGTLASNASTTISKSTQRNFMDRPPRDINLRSQEKQDRDVARLQGIHSKTTYSDGAPKT